MPLTCSIYDNPDDFPFNALFLLEKIKSFCSFYFEDFIFGLDFGVSLSVSQQVAMQWVLIFMLWFDGVGKE